MLVDSSGARLADETAAQPAPPQGSDKTTPSVGISFDPLLGGGMPLEADLPTVAGRASSLPPGDVREPPASNAMPHFGELDDLLDLPAPDLSDLPMPKAPAAAPPRTASKSEARRITPTQLSPQPQKQPQPAAKPTVQMLRPAAPDDWASLKDEELDADLPMVPDRDSFLPAPSPARRDSFGAIELPTAPVSSPSAASPKALPKERGRSSAQLPVPASELPKAVDSSPVLAQKAPPKRKDSIDLAFDFENAAPEAPKPQGFPEKDRPTVRAAVPLPMAEPSLSGGDQKTVKAESPLALGNLDAIEFDDLPQDQWTQPVEPPSNLIELSMPTGMAESGAPPPIELEALPPLEFAPEGDAPPPVPDLPPPPQSAKPQNPIELAKDEGGFQFKEEAAPPVQSERPKRARLPSEGPAGGAAEADDKPQKSKLIRNLIAAGIVAIAGAGLTLIPDVGAFGWMWVADKVLEGSHSQALNEVKGAVQANFATDTYPASAGAYAKVKAAEQNAPRHRPTLSYAAYVAFARAIRFGKKGADEARARQLLAYASSAPSPEFTLGTAAQQALSGQLDNARASASGLLKTSPSNIDAAVLLGEIELLAKSGDKAVAAWKKAVEINKNARTLYGMARAAFAAGQREASEENARAALGVSPAHPGAHTLIASLIWARGEKEEAEALALLAKVTGEGDVKNAAGERDLVEANSVLGTIHLARSRNSAAEQAFGAALKLDPQAMEALLGNGELLYRAGRFSEASARFEAAIRADAQNIQAKVGAAKTWMAQERTKEAKDLLRKARESQPKEALLAYYLGRAEDALGNKKEAEAAYAEAISLGKGEEDLVSAYVALSYLLGSLGRAEDAAAKLNEAAEKFPNSPALHKAKGEIALSLGRYDEAKQELEASLAQKDDLSTRFKLGVTLRRMRSFEEAAKVFDQIGAADKEFPGLSLERGLLFEETGQSDKALEMYKTALEKAPDDLDLKLRVGSTQVMAGRGNLAEPLLREVVKQRPNSAEASHFLGRALLSKGVAIAEALRFLERATEIDPNRGEYFLYVGWAANESGQASKADSALKRALELDKELGDAHWQRGVLLQKQGATADALAELQIALQKRPSRFEAYATMALCFQDQARWPEAEEAWRKAIAGNDEVPEWHYRIGKIYASRGNRAASGPEMVKAIAQVEASPRPKPAWLFDAHFLAAEALRNAGDKNKSIEHFNKFLKLSPPDNAYRADAERALKSMGAWPPPQ